MVSTDILHWCYCHSHYSSRFIIRFEFPTKRGEMKQEKQKRFISCLCMNVRLISFFFFFCTNIENEKMFVDESEKTTNEEIHLIDKFETVKVKVRIFSTGINFEHLLSPVFRILFEHFEYSSRSLRKLNKQQINMNERSTKTTYR